jgi:hypothetical protein
MTVTEPPRGTPEKSRTSRWVLSTPVLVVVLMVAMLGIGGALGAALLTGQDAKDQAATVASDTAPAVLTLDTLCKRNDQLGADLRNIGACGEKIDKAKSAVDGQPQPAVASGGLSRDDVVAIVAGQLAGKTVTVDQVMAMVTQVYNANKPKDGPAPTGDQVLAAVQAVCGTTKCQGPQGEKGADANDAQIFNQVAAYCSGDNAPCRGPMGPQGDQGPQGISVVAQQFVRNDQGDCRSQVTLSDGRVLDGGPAGDAACPPDAPPTT